MTKCTLCELPVGDSPITATDVDGRFCCQGCLSVYQSLGDIDLKEYNSQEATEESQSLPDNAETAYLAVGGMHCATCEVFLETTAQKKSGVYDAEASYAAEAVKVSYDPEQTTTDDVTEDLSKLGYTARERGESTPSGPDMASRLLVGGFFGMMAMTWYIIFLYPTYFGFDPIVTLGQWDGLYVYGQLAAVTSIILFYTGYPMLRGAYISIRARRPNVDLLVTIAALAAYLYSTGRIFMGESDLYYDVTIVVVMAVTVGNYYESRIKRQTAGLLADLTELQVDEATRVDGETISIDEVEPGEKLRVTPGERIPVDGTVAEGTAAVDEALVTGESLPTTKRPGDDVRGGTVVTDAPMVITAGEEAESTLDRVVGMLWDIQATKPGAQRVADTLATIFVPLVLVIAALAAGGILLTGGSAQIAMLTALTVLIVSCPCALGLATPLAVASGLQSAANQGIVVTTPALFEHSADVETIVFDKTGTLTDGEMSVKETVSEDGTSADILTQAALVEQFSTHPIATAITGKANETTPVTDGGTDHLTEQSNGVLTRGPTPETDSSQGILDSFERFPRGVSATVEGEYTVVGHPSLLETEGMSISTELGEEIESIRQRGDVPVVVGWNGRARGVIAVGDVEREEWESVITTIGPSHRIIVLTGDDGPAAERFREHEHVDDVFAGVPPDGKAETVRRLAASETVAMVGDGSNDAPALAVADVGIAVEGGTQLATDAADAIVLDGDLRQVPRVFDTAKGTRTRIKENLAWAFVYNGIAIPLALTGLLNPLFAALAMATSSLLVVANSAREPPLS